MALIPFWKGPRVGPPPPVVPFCQARSATAPAIPDAWTAARMRISPVCVQGQGYYTSAPVLAYGGGAPRQFRSQR